MMEEIICLSIYPKIGEDASNFGIGSNLIRYV